MAPTLMVPYNLQWCLFLGKVNLHARVQLRIQTQVFLLKIIFKHDLAWKLEQRQKAPNDVRNESDLRRATNTKCKWGCLLKHKSYIFGYITL